MNTNAESNVLSKIVIALTSMFYLFRQFHYSHAGVQHLEIVVDQTTQILILKSDGYSTFFAKPLDYGDINKTTSYVDDNHIYSSTHKNV